MKSVTAALWTEGLKVLRSKVPLFILIGFSIAPLVAGLFMIILKDPAAARDMGLINTKAQLAAGSADWLSFFSILSQAVAIGGMLVFAILTSWIFGREFSDHTVKELLALPTPRMVITAVKFFYILMLGWGIILWIFMLGLLIGSLVAIPGWSIGLAYRSFWLIFLSGSLTLLMMTPVAFFASVGRGFLPPLGWAIFTLILAQIAGITGWGSWFPWSIPAMLAELSGPLSAQIGLHSYILVVFTSFVGAAATIFWWNTADQTK
jgi:ABC-2 type transport system permease protein